MSKYSEKTQKWATEVALMIVAISDRDKIALKRAEANLLEMVALEGYESIHRDMVKGFAKQEDGAETLLWLAAVYNEEDPDGEEALVKAKQAFHQVLLESNYKSEVDFRFTQNGSIKFLSDKAKKFVQEEVCPSTDHWKRLLLSGIVEN